MGAKRIARHDRCALRRADDALSSEVIWADTWELLLARKRLTHDVPPMDQPARPTVREAVLAVLVRIVHVARPGSVGLCQARRAINSVASGAAIEASESRSATERCHFERLTSFCESSWQEVHRDRAEIGSRPKFTTGRRQEVDLRLPTGGSPGSNVPWRGVARRRRIPPQVRRIDPRVEARGGIRRARAWCGDPGAHFDCVGSSTCCSRASAESLAHGPAWPI